MYQLSVRVIFDSGKVVWFTKEYATIEEAQTLASTLLEDIEAAKDTITIPDLGFDREHQGWLSLAHVAALTTEIFPFT